MRRNASLTSSNFNYTYMFNEEKIILNDVLKVMNRTDFFILSFLSNQKMINLNINSCLDFNNF